MNFEKMFRLGKGNKENPSMFSSFSWIMEVSKFGMT